MLEFLKQKKEIPLSVDKDTAITQVRYVALDTELTGLNERKDSIISIGAVRIKGTKIELGNTFHQLVKPGSKFKTDSVVVHGITPSDVLEKPNIDAILSDFLEFCSSDPLIGYCIGIDISFINKEMKRVFGTMISNPVIDTYNVYTWLKVKVPNSSFSSLPLKDSSLYEIAKHFDIPVRGAHNALVDAFIAAQLFQRFIPVLVGAGIKTIGDLLVIGHPSEGGDKFRKSTETANF
jgi:DNA polymerase III subunit epsilon